MTFLLVVGLICLGLAVACAWADCQPPTDPDLYDQPTHVRVLTDQEPSA